MPDRLFKPPVDGQINGVCFHIQKSSQSQDEVRCNPQLSKLHSKEAYVEV